MVKRGGNKDNNNNKESNTNNTMGKEPAKEQSKITLLDYNDNIDVDKSKAAKEIKVNKYNSGGVKQAIDDIICEFLLERTHRSENNNVTNLRIVLSFIGCVVAVAAQFHTYIIKFNTPLIIVCVSIYGLISLILAAVMKFKVKDNIIIVKSDKFFGGLGENSDDEIVVSTEAEEFDAKYRVTLEDRGASVKKGVSAKKEFETTAWIDVNGVVHQDVVSKDFGKFFDDFLKEKLQSYKSKSD